MAAHSTILARKIPWTEEPGGIRSMGSHKELDTIYSQKSVSMNFWHFKFSYRLLSAYYIPGTFFKLFLIINIYKVKHYLSSFKLSKPR